MPKTPADLFSEYGVPYDPPSALQCAPENKRRKELENLQGIIKHIEIFFHNTVGKSLHSIPVLHELHSLTVDGIYPCGGTFRDATVKVEITGSTHQLPPSDEVAPLLTEMFTDARKWDPNWLPMQRVNMAADNFHRILNIHPYRGGNGRVARAYLHLSLYEMEVIQPPNTLFEYMLYRRH